MAVWSNDVQPLIQQAIAELERTKGLAKAGDLPDPKAVDDGLRAHGLTGPQLRTKLDQFGAAIAALLAEVDSIDEAERYWRTWLSRLRGSRASQWVGLRLEGLRRAGRRALQSRLGRVLRVANNVLDSLADVLSFIPGIAATKEFKESLEIAVEEPDEISKPASPQVSLKKLGERFRVS